MVEIINKSMIPEDHLIKVGIDTSTLIRLFKGLWKTAEMMIYLQFFKIKIAPTVYEEFLNYQDSKRWLKLSIKKKFLRKILGAEVILPSSLDDEDTEPEDSKIYKEYSEMDVDFLLTDGDDFDKLTNSSNRIRILNAKNIWWKFGEFKR